MASVNLKKELELMNKEYQGSDAILGKNLLTLANRINSSRGLMFSSELDQVVPLEQNEIPKVNTNYEYLVGKYSSAYYKAESDLQVISKISKFPNSPNSIFILLVYDAKRKLYDVIYRVPGERLTETYGYKYKNEVIDNINIGDEINKDDVLYKSTSFDENMLYGYGTNIRTLYTTDPMTIEDAIVIDKTTAKKLYSIEYDVVRISLNDNDILINLYGGKDDYKAFPDVGEEVEDSTLAVKRRITYAQSLFDLKEENMRKVLATDDPYYVPFAEDKVVDISVYSNKTLEELEETVYNKQILDHLKNELSYYEDIERTLKPIIEKGRKHYSDDLAELYSRARRALDPETKWKERDSDTRIFNNIVLEFMIEKRVPVVIGSKLCGRYGDKGVISEIREDEDMPILENGKRVHMICNILGVGNRENPGQFYEVELNYQGEFIVDRMKKTDDISIKEYYLFGFLDIVSNDYSNRMKEWYGNLSKEDKLYFLKDIEDNGLYIEQPPMYNNVSFNQLAEAYHKFNIKPMKAYVERFGRLIEMQMPVISSYKYILKLKHHKHTCGV